MRLTVATFLGCNGPFLWLNYRLRAKMNRHQQTTDRYYFSMQRVLRPAASLSSELLASDMLFGLNLAKVEITAK